MLLSIRLSNENTNEVDDESVGVEEDDDEGEDDIVAVIFSGVSFKSTIIS